MPRIVNLRQFIILNFRINYDCYYTGYEKNIEPKKAILYIQLEKEKFPTGTKWVREEQDFKNNFKLE